MSDLIKISVVEEKPCIINTDKEEINVSNETPRLMVYITLNNGMSSWIGQIDNYSDLDYMLENFQDELVAALSEEEYNLITAKLDYDNYNVQVGNKSINLRTYGEYANA